MVVGGGGVFPLKWKWSWASHSQMQAGRGGFGAKSPKLSARVWFWAASVQFVLKGLLYVYSNPS